MTLRVFTAFSGYDSQCLALDRLKRDYPSFDYELVGWSEIDKYAIQAHNALYPQWADRNFGDISKTDWDQVPDFDLFTYSSPCQDFSNAGLQRGGEEGSGTRSSLLWECRRAIIAKRPKYCLLENVKALVSKKFMPLFNKWQDELAEYGYANFWQVLNAKQYGVPQNRERVFLWSILRTEAEPRPEYHFPRPLPLELRLKDVLEEHVDEKYYLSEKLITSLSHDNKGFSAMNPSTPPPYRSSIVFDGENAQNGPRRQLCKRSNIMESIIQIGNIVDDTSIGFKNPQRGRVYDAEGIAPCLNTCGGGGLVPKIAALRGRNPDNPSERGKSNGNYKQRLEMNENGTSNTLTSVQKDNLVVEPMCSVHPNSHKFEFNPATSIKPISPALRATDYKAPPCAWEPQVMTPKRTAFGKAVRKEYEKGILTISRHEMITMEPREDGVSNTLTSVQKDNLLCEPRYRIRKLTPRECFRLMGVDDKDIDTIQAAGISNSQQYKMAGNSIVVDVLYHQFVKAFIDQTPTEPFYQQTLF